MTSLVKYLSAEQIAQIVKELVADLQNKENIASLKELLPLIKQQDIAQPVYSFIVASIKSKDNNKDLLELLVKLEVCDKVADWIVSATLPLIKDRIPIQSEDVEEVLEDIDLHYVVTIIEQLLSLDYKSSQLDQLVLLLILLDDEEVSDTATKALRYVGEYKTEYIPILLNSHLSYHVTNGYIVWLRALLRNKQLVIDNQLQFLQAGLISEVHEHRKYSLSILKFLKEDAKFITLFEIIGIDSSMNQAEAARHDIEELIVTKPDWGLILLVTGLKNGMDSIKKFLLEIVFGIQDLKILDSEHLTTLLKFAVEAVHFNDADYGDRLEQFLINLFKSLSDKAFVGVLILNLLVKLKSTFAPARIYLSSGLLKGLAAHKVFTSEHFGLFISLFESTSEDDLFQIYLQSIHLLLLLNIDDDSLILLLLSKFVILNGYSIFKQNIDSFKHIKYSESDNTEIEYQVIIYSLFQNTSDSEDFLKELAFSQLPIDPVLTDRYWSLIASLQSNTESDYNKSVHLLNLGLTKRSDTTMLYESVLSDFSIEKFKFYSEWIIQTGSIDYGTLESLSELIDLNVDFKTKDLIVYNYHLLLLHYLSSNKIEISAALSLIKEQALNSYFYGFIGICSTIQHLLANYPFDSTIVDILQSMWTKITSDRLILSQRKMHQTFIETLYHESILKASIDDKSLSDVLLKISESIIKQSFTRRSLAPTLSRQLLNYSGLEQTKGVISIMVSLLSLVQDDTHVFKIKNTISVKYNELFTGNLYNEVYGDEEVSAKVNVISILNKASPQYSDLYFSELLHTNQFNVIIPIKKADGKEELKRIYLFGSLLSISKKVSPSLLSSITKDNLLPLLETESSPLIRTYLEWIISIDLIQSSTNREPVFDLFKDHNKPSLVTSVERIVMLVSAHIESEEYINRFIQYLIPNCSSNKPLIRHFSNSLLLSLYPLIQSKKIKLPIENVLFTLYQQAKKAETVGKFRSGDALVWDAVEDFNLVSIFGGVLTNVTSRDIELITESSFIKYAESGDIPIGHTKITKNLNEDVIVSKEKVNSPLQTKSGAWETVLDIDEKSRSIKRSDLIVVSSLVDKAPNLGGICRLCDVLGAGLMTVDDLRVKQHPQFKSVAVTADYWMPLAEVKIDDIVNFMIEKKKAGYTLIGLEQTDKSIVLGNETKFPKKSLILLGKEAEGIPGHLLAELDYCIEIRQQGVIRSMNIQTATAVIVHAYACSQ